MKSQENAACNKLITVYKKLDYVQQVVYITGEDWWYIALRHSIKCKALEK